MRYTRTTVIVGCLLALAAGGGARAQRADSPTFRENPWADGPMPRSVPDLAQKRPPALRLLDLVATDRRSTPVSVTPPVRVSSDLLPVAGAAQPETQAEPYLAVDPANPLHLIASWQENRFSDGGARTLGVAATFDGGITWSEGVLPRLTHVDGGAWDRASDPWVAFGANGRVYAASLLFDRSSPDNAVGVSASDDGGVTWTAPVEVFRSVADFNDKEAVVVDTGTRSPRAGTVYAAWDINIQKNGTTVQRLVVSRSSDGGRSWSKPVAVRRKNGNVGVIPRVGPDGTLYLVWAGSTKRSRNLRVFFAKSVDGGASWSRSRKLEKILSNGVQTFRSGAFLPSFDVDGETGDLYIAWGDARWTGVDQATLLVSRDGGETWSSAARVSDGADDAPVLTVSVAASSGAVGVSYYSLENDPARRSLLNTYIRVSTDGGASFRPSTRVTPESFDARFAAVAGGAMFLGDYAGLTASPGSFALLWVGTDLPSVIDPTRRQPDVFLARAIP